MRADLDTLLTAIYVLLDDFLPDREGPGRRPKITDAELITLAVAQVFLGVPDDRRFLAFAAWRLGHLFPYPPRQPGYNKRLRSLAPQIVALGQLSRPSSRPSLFDGLRLLDSTPVPCGASRETVRRPEFAGTAAYGHRASHGRWFWGFRLYLLCASDGTPIAFELAPANAPERQVAMEMLEGVGLAGHTVIADKGFSGREFEGFMADRGAVFLRPDRKDEKPRFGPLGSVRQRIESVFWTRKGQLGLERHGARTMPGLFARIGMRLLALSAGLWHNWQIDRPGRHFATYTY